MKKIEKPAAGEFAPETIMYIGLLPDDGRILDHLANNLRATSEFVLSLPEEKLTYRYAEGKWTIKEILVPSATMSESTPTGLYALLAVTKPICRALIRMPTPFTRAQMNAISKTSCMNLPQCGKPLSLYSTRLTAKRS